MRPPTRNTRSTSTRVFVDTSTSTTTKEIPGETDTSQPPKSTLVSSKKGPHTSGKTKKSRHRMTNQQLDRLEALYQKSTHPSRHAKQELGDEVGMDVRTVTVWFQNRRQIAKKSPDLGVPTATSAASRSLTPAQPRVSSAVSRPPLALVSHRNLPNNQKTSATASVTTVPLYPTPVAMLPIVYPFPQTHQPLQPARPVQPTQPVQPHDLWKYIPSSPPTSQLANTPTPTTPSALEESPYIEGDTVPIAKRKRTLDWACSRLEKRQRMSKDPDNEDSGDTTDATEDEARTERAQIEPHTALGLGIQDPKSTETVVARKVFEIPSEYHASFPADIVLGASLLLTLKHSSG